MRIVLAVAGLFVGLALGQAVAPAFFTSGTDTVTGTQIVYGRISAIDLPSQTFLFRYSPESVPIRFSFDSRTVWADTAIDNTGTYLEHRVRTAADIADGSRIRARISYVTHTPYALFVEAGRPDTL